MADINIDATNAIVGRLATFVAKQALLGNNVNVFNCEKAVFSGNPRAVRERYYKKMFDVGQPFKGPHFPKMSDRFVKRVIRGMLDYKHGRGLSAYKRIKCYVGVPMEFEKVEMKKIGKTAMDLPNWKRLSVGDLCKSLGGRS